MIWFHSPFRFDKVKAASEFGQLHVPGPGLCLSWLYRASSFGVIQISLRAQGNRVLRIWDLGFKGFLELRIQGLGLQAQESGAFGRFFGLR